MNNIIINSLKYIKRLKLRYSGIKNYSSISNYNNVENQEDRELFSQIKLDLEQLHLMNLKKKETRSSNNSDSSIIKNNVNNGNGKFYVFSKNNVVNGNGSRINSFSFQFDKNQIPLIVENRNLHSDKNKKKSNFEQLQQKEEVYSDIGSLNNSGGNKKSAFRFDKKEIPLIVEKRNLIKKLRIQQKEDDEDKTLEQVSFSNSINSGGGNKKSAFQFNKNEIPLIVEKRNLHSDKKSKKSKFNQLKEEEEEEEEEKEEEKEDSNRSNSGITKTSFKFNKNEIPLIVEKRKLIKNNNNNNIIRNYISTNNFNNFKNNNNNNNFFNIIKRNYTSINNRRSNSNSISSSSNNNNNSNNDLKEISEFNDDLEFIKLNVFKNFDDKLKNEKNVIVSCSGGSDSMLVLHLLKEWKRKENKELKVRVLTVDHRVEAENIKEIKRIVNNVIGNSKYFTYDIVQLEDPKSFGGIQEKLRNTRYLLLKLFSENIQKEENQNSKPIISLYGTNLSDSLETFIQRISTNSGLDGLCGISKEFQISKSSLIYRPLIEISKNDIFKYCKRHSIEYYEDPTNSTLDFTRNLNRILINQYQDLSSTKDLQYYAEGLKMFEFIKCNTNKSIDQILKKLVEEQFNDKIKRISLPYLPVLRIPCKLLESYPKAISTRIIHKASMLLLNEFQQFKQLTFSQIVSQMLENNFNSFYISKFTSIRKSQKSMCYEIQVDLSSLNKPTKVDFNQINQIASYSFSVQKNRHYQKVEDLFFRGFNKRDLQNLNENVKRLIKNIPFYQRSSLLVFVNSSDEILAIPSLKYYSSSFSNLYFLRFDLDVNFNNIKTIWSD